MNRTHLLALARRVWRRLRRDDGQMLVLLAPVLLMFMAAGVLSVEVGLFVSDRRDAQGVADRAAHAGAVALTLDPTQTSAAANTAAVQFMTLNHYDRNDATGTYTVTITKDCYSANDGAYDKVAITLTRKPTMTGFLKYFGLTWTGGAQATACVGRPLTSGDIFPFAMSADSSCFDQTTTPSHPILGGICAIRVDTTTSQTGTYGALSIDPNGPSCSDAGAGANDLQTDIETGAHVRCAVYPGTGPGIPDDYVNTKQGNTVGKTKAGLQCRLTGSAGCVPVATCDATHHIAAGDADTAALPLPHYAPPTNGIDDIFEIWTRDPAEPVGSVRRAAPNDCNAGVAGVQTSPRNIMMVVVNHSLAPDGNTCGGNNNSYCVRGFERAYLEGCLDGSGVFVPRCDTLPGSQFWVLVRFVEQLTPASGNIGAGGYGDIGIQMVR